MLLQVAVGFSNSDKLLRHVGVSNILGHTALPLMVRGAHSDEAAKCQKRS